MEILRDISHTAVEILRKMTGQNRLKQYEGDGHLVGKLRHNDGEQYGGDGDFRKNISTNIA